MASTVRLPTAFKISSALQEGSTTMVASPSEMMYTLLPSMPSVTNSTGTHVLLTFFT